MWTNKIILLDFPNYYIEDTFGLCFVSLIKSLFVEFPTKKGTPRGLNWDSSTSKVNVGFQITFIQNLQNFSMERKNSLEKKT